MVTDPLPRPNPDEPSWEPGKWPPHAGCFMEFVVSNRGDPVTVWERHAYDHAWWRAIVPPSRSLHESVRHALGEVLEERWVVDTVDDKTFVVQRTDRTDLVIKVQRRRTNVNGDPHNPRSPFRIRSVGPYGCVIEGVLVSIIFPAASKVRRTKLAKFTEPGPTFNNRAHSFEIFRKSESLGLVAHLSGIWPTVRRPILAHERELVPPSPVAPGQSLLALRTVWAVWIMADLAQARLNEPRRW